MNVSVVVPFRSDDPERLRIFEWVLARWAALYPDLPVVTPHDGATEGPFNRSRAVNRGVAMCDTDVVVVADADICVSPNAVRRMNVALTTGRAPWVVGYDRMVHLTDDYTHGENGVLADRPDVEFAEPFGRSMFIRWQSTRSVCGLIGFRRDDYVGFDERFAGWGWEDTSFAAAMDTLVGGHWRADADCLHLFHALRRNRKNDEDARANRKLGRRYDFAAGDPDAMTLLIREAINAA